MPDDNAVGKRSTPEQREKLGVGKAAKGSRTPPVEPTNAMQQVDVHIHMCLVLLVKLWIYYRHILTSFILYPSYVSWRSQNKMMDFQTLVIYWEI